MYTGALLLNLMTVLVALKDYRPPIKLCRFPCFKCYLEYSVPMVILINRSYVNKKNIKHTKNPTFDRKSK